ncbi:MAG: LysE family transporter [Reichenbachiella sp.]|uniref:LysE family translocator n=1 Tax=Reichenbachiella sp. TaxID=2184521 RepID=UPI0032631349
MIAYLIGLLAGFVPALSTGPVFLTLVQNSIDHGFKKTVYFIIGVALTDTAVILLTWFGLSQISEGSEAPIELALGGGVLLMVFGLVFIFKKEKSKELDQATSSGKLKKLGLFTQAIMLNAINPIVWGFWAAISNYAITEFNDSTNELLFFVGVLNTIWMTDLLKAHYAQKLKRFLTGKLKGYLKIGIGLVLLFLGLKMVITPLF